MTERREPVASENQVEESQAERISGQPVDANAEIWKPAEDEDHPDRESREERVEDPAGRPEPYVKGPTGSAPLATEFRGDPGAEGERGAEGGAAAGAVAGTSLAGPVGGVIGAMAGGALGTAADEDPQPLPDDLVDPATASSAEAEARE